MSCGIFMMPKGRPKAHCHKDIFPVMEGDSPSFCFSCEQLFPDRTWLEEHTCAAVSYICSCGTEFSHYLDMLEHSGEHEPGYAVLNHATIQMRRFAKHQEQDQQLKKLESVGQGPNMEPTSEIMTSTCSTTYSSQLPFQSVRVPKVPAIYTRISKGHLPSEPIPTQQITFGAPDNLDSPTIDLWPKFQPVVLIENLSRFVTNKPYCCFKCKQGFTTKDNLIVHYSTHIKKKVYGCLGCGKLLSGKKLMPHRHWCGSDATKFNPKFVNTCPKQNYKTTYGLVNRNPVIIPKDLKKISLSKQFQVRNGFNCRVCQVSFATIQLLQRHKCIKAHEFVTRQAIVFPKYANKCTQEQSFKHSYLSLHRNVEMFGINIQTSSHAYHNKAVRPKTFADRPTQNEVDVDDDCYVVGSSPGNSTQILQPLSSAIPIIKI